MKVHKKLLLSFLGFVLSACGNPESDSTMAVPAPIIEGTAIYRDEGGSLINPAGWEIPTISVKNLEFSLVEGRGNSAGPKVYSHYYMPGDELLFSGPRVTETEITMVSKKVFSIQVFKGKDQRPFCYRIASYMDSSNSDRGGMLLAGFISDSDGDGIYETYAGTYFIPNWVK